MTLAESIAGDTPRKSFVTNKSRFGLGRSGGGVRLPSRATVLCFALNDSLDASSPIDFDTMAVASLDPTMLGLDKQSVDVDVPSAAPSSTTDADTGDAS